MTQLTLLTSDRQGNVIMKGIDGTTVAYNGTDYTYYGPADLTITENQDGTVDYDFTLKQGLKFSDGTPITIDDVIFTMYVYSDPAYDGSTTFFALPIKGMQEYRDGSQTLLTLLLDAGEDNTDFTYFTEQQRKDFWENDLQAAGEQFAKSIAQYCIANGYIEESVEEHVIANGMVNWGFASVNEDGSITTGVTGTTYTLEGDDEPNEVDFWNEMMAAY